MWLTSPCVLFFKIACLFWVFMPCLNQGCIDTIFMPSEGKVPFTETYLNPSPRELGIGFKLWQPHPYSWVIKSRECYAINKSARAKNPNSSKVDKEPTQTCSIKKESLQLCPEAPLNSTKQSLRSNPPPQSCLYTSISAPTSIHTTSWILPLVSAFHIKSLPTFTVAALVHQEH